MEYTSTENMAIFQPIKIGNMELKNRIGIGPYGSHPSDPDGCPNDMTVDYYRQLAASGVGYIQVGIVNPIPEDAGIQYSCRVRIRFSDERHVAAWKKVTDVIHSYGAKCSIQLGLFGYMQGNYFSDLDEDMKKYAYNDMGNGETSTKYKESYLMTSEDIQKIIEYCGIAAARAKQAGFDGVSVHNAHSDIMFGACSLDPMFNSRDDEWGGSIENRLRFTVEMVKEMKRTTGDDFPVSLRINGDDLKGELGNTSEDICKYIVPALEAAGLDYFDISQGGSLYAGQGCLPVLYYPRACWIHLAAAIKKAAHIPVIGVGRVTSLEMAEKIIREGLVDILYFGREAYVDKEWIHKFQEGKNLPCDVRQCIGCDTRCFPCSVNYESNGMVGFLGETISMEKSASDQKMLIIGGGVAGMEAARVAAMRGYRVTLWEKAGKLGGNVGIMATTPHLCEFQNFIDYLQGQMTALNVDVRVCYAATPERIRAFAPDIVILATGTREELPEQFKGQPMVMTLFEAMERRREFRSFADWHKKIWFAGFSGCEFALDLAAEGAEVTMVGPGGDKAVAAESWFTRDRKVYLRKRLTDGNFIRRSKDTERADIKMLFRSKIEYVDSEGVHYYHNGIHKVSPYDAVIVTSPRKRNDELFEAIQEFVPAVYKIGDCNKIALIADAVKAANELVRTL